MRKLHFTALLLGLSLCACLTACGDESYHAASEACDHDKYEEILSLLEDGDYEGAKNAIDELADTDDIEDTESNRPVDTTTNQIIVSPGDDPIDKPTTNEPADKPVTDLPAEDEREGRYQQTMDYLGKYLENGCFYSSQQSKMLEGNEALEFLYNEFSQMGDYADCKEQVSRFTIYRDMLTSQELTTTDHLGNVKTNTEYFYQYDALGRILRTDAPEYEELYGYELGGTVPYFNFEYDENDRVNRIVVITYNGDTDAILTPAYNADGTLASLHVLTNTENVTCHFTYDANGNRITAETFDRSYREIIPDKKYTYENGRLVRLTYTGLSSYPHVVTYTYDDDGKLIQVANTQFGGAAHNIPLTQTTVYHYDNDGKLTSGVCTTDAPDSVYASKEYTYVYEDLYFYTPAE